MNLSILSQNTDEQRKALEASQLKVLISNPDTFNRMAVAAAHLLNSDDLRACDELSILGALYKAVTLGFRLEPEFGECYLIPRKLYDKKTKESKQVCSFQIGYRGWKAMMMQTGYVSNIQAREVYKEDQFFVKYGTAAMIEHTPADENSGVTTHFYAYAKLKDGNEIFEVINKQAAEKSRKFSESQYEKIGTYPNQTKKFSEKPVGFWANGYAAMALRGPIKKLAAMLPLTPAIETAMQEDGAINYLQKDGSVMKVSPAEVEETAEKIQTIEIGIAPDLIPRYQDLQDGLMGLTDFDSVLNYYTTQFKESDLADNRNFAKLIFDRVCEVVKTVKELGDFFHSVKDVWKDDKELMKIISRKKQALENAK